LIRQPFLNFVHPDDRKETVRVMKELLRGQPVIQFCNRYRHVDGHYLVLEWTAQALPNESNIFAVARDITHRPASKN
jgi:PAS domain S-box-containing protein